MYVCRPASSPPNEKSPVLNFAARTYHCRAMLHLFKAIPNRLLDLCLPPRCLNCEVETRDPLALCPTCWEALSFLHSPQCRCCGLPFTDSRQQQNTLCGRCIASPPPYTACRSALVYDEASKPVILRFKHADRTDSAALLAQWLYQAGTELLEASDLIIPVPLHRSRLLKRRYNQSALLASALSRKTGIPWKGNLLLRHRKTENQGLFSREGRQRNVAGAFNCPSRYKEVLQNKSVLLIDDVHTTGATAESCSKALLRAGAQKVRVLTVARVLPGS